MERLETTDAVIKALGGVRAVATLVGARTTTVVQNWRKRRFPARFYPQMKSALASRGLDASRELWGVPELESGAVE